MKLINRFMLVACLALPFAACKKEEEAPKETVAAPLPAPTTDDKTAWQTYLQDQVPRHMEGIANSPFIYRVPAQANPADPEEYNRLLEKAKTDLARGVIAGNLLAYAGLDSAKTADLVVESFEPIEPNSMKGVRVLFIGSADQNERVKAVVEPTGSEYIFVQTN